MIQSRFRLLSIMLLMSSQYAVRAENVSFLSACRQIYGTGEIASNRKSSGPATLRRTVDALIEADGVLVGTIDAPNTCVLHERILSKMQGLELSSLELVDIRPLSVLARVQSLTLSNNAIEDLTPLSGLTTLRTLDVSGNRVSDISPLKSLKDLQALRAMRNNIKDISSLADLRLLAII